MKWYVYIEHIFFQDHPAGQSSSDSGEFCDNLDVGDIHTTGKEHDRKS